MIKAIAVLAIMAIPSLAHAETCIRYQTVTVIDEAFEWDYQNTTQINVQSQPWYDTWTVEITGENQSKTSDTTEGVCLRQPVGTVHVSVRPHFDADRESGLSITDVTLRLLQTCDQSEN